MVTLYRKSAQFPIGVIAGMSVIGTGGFLFNGDGWLAGGCLAIAVAACGVSAWLTTREG